MSDAPKLPYIKRLELDKERLTNALMLVVEYHKALEFANITGRKADAYGVVDGLKAKMTAAINEALYT